MFQLVALLFLVTNGVVSEKPDQVIPNKRTFPSVEACAQFIESDAGEKAKAALDGLLKARGVEVATRLACVPKIEDDAHRGGEL